MRQSWFGLLAIFAWSACGGRVIDPDDLCNPPSSDSINCLASDPMICPMSDGTHWERLESGVWLHLQDRPLRVLCDVAPDGSVIARTP